MQIKRIAGALGAEISGVDLTKDLSSEEVKKIRNVFL